MEGFWSHGDLAQTIAFPFEVIGCMLVAWEIFTPKVADRIEEWMDENSSKENWRRKLDMFIPYLFLIISVWAFLDEIFDDMQWDLIQDAPVLRLIYIVIYYILGPVIFLLLYLYLVLRWIVPPVLSFLNHITGEDKEKGIDGKAIGAIGFFLSLIGLTCELYQYTGLSLQECRWVMAAVGVCRP